jgi:peptidoglycan/LPS O-acetylase OafA/YrhL
VTQARNALQEQIAPDTPVTQERVPALDGLRGLAILLVMMIHFAQANPRSFHWVNHVFDTFLRIGWIGVDLFFVLSGFLITGILCDARARPHYFRNFYMRRTLRIFPLYYASLVLLLVVLPRLAAPRPELQSAVESAGWYWTYLVNVRTAQSAGSMRRTSATSGRSLSRSSSTCCGRSWFCDSTVEP